MRSGLPTTLSGTGACERAGGKRGLDMDLAGSQPALSTSSLADGAEDFFMYELAALPDVLPELPGPDEAFDAGGQVQHHQVLPRASEWHGFCYEADAGPP